MSKINQQSHTNAFGEYNNFELCLAIIKILIKKEWKHHAMYMQQNENHHCNDFHCFELDSMLKKVRS